MEPNTVVVAVGAVILSEEGEVLLVKHRPERGGYWQGKWICPGGKLEAGETIREGILREVKEETHLEVELIKPLVPFERIVKTEGETELHVIYIDYLAKRVGGDLTPDDDVNEAIWVSRQELKERWDELHVDTQRLMEIAGVT